MKKQWKYPIAVLATFSLSGGWMTPAFADTTGQTTSSATSSASNASSTASSNATSSVAISQQQAIDTATKLLPIPAGYTMSGANLQDNWAFHQGPVYNINWQGPVTQSSNPIGRSVMMNFSSATIDANTGMVLSFSSEAKSNNWYDSPTISQSEAQQTAERLLNTLAPDEAGQMTLNPSSAGVFYGSNGFSFSFMRTVNGVPAPFDSAQIFIGPDGSLMNYQFSWHTAIFPSATPAITMQQASDTYRTALGLHLGYVEPNTPDPQNAATLAYLPSTQGNTGYGGMTGSGPWIDAATGDALDPSGQSIDVTQATPTYTPLVADGPKQFPTRLTTALNQSDAEAIARKTLNLSTDVKVSSANTGQYQAPGGITGTSWNLVFQGSNPNNQFQVTIDAQSGLIMNYNQFPPQPPTQVAAPSTVTSQQALQSAEDFLKQAYPTLTGAIAPIPSSTKPIANQPYSENFTILHDGVPIENDISVQLNSNGQVNGLFFSPWILAPSFPNATDVVSLSQAQDAYVNQVPLQLTYELPATAVSSSNGIQLDYSSTARLVYAQLGYTSGWLDAITGKWAATGIPTSTPTDIQGANGAEEMTLLAAHGTLPLTDGQAHPSALVTRGTFVSWLVKASNFTMGSSGTEPLDFTDVPMSSPYYGDLHQAVIQGWLPAGGAFQPDTALTRADAASFIVDWLQWNNIAKKSSLFADPFSDADTIPADKLGAAIMASDFGIVPPDNGAFLPTNVMTVADASIAIVHAFRVANGQD
jgi:hypothetical protein